MRRTPLIIAAALSVGVATFAQQTPKATPPSSNTPPIKKPDFKDYASLVDRNMFVRELHAPVQARPYIPRAPRVDPNSPEQKEKFLVLRGVAIEDAELHAYFENSRSGDVVRVTPGDDLVSGRVTDIAIDAVAYTVGNKTAWISVGENLAGIRTATASPEDGGPSTQPTDGTTTAAGGLPALPAGGPLPPGGGSLEERMKARRALQRGTPR